MRLHRTCALVAAMTAGFAVGAGAADPEEATLGDRVEAIVADSVITYQQVDRYIEPGLQSVAGRYGVNSEEYRRAVRDLESEGLSYLVSRQLILHDFQASGFNVPESIIDDYVQDEIHRRYGQDRVQFTKVLQSEGLTYEQFRKEQRDMLIISEMTHKNVPDPIISPHKVEAYYNENRDVLYKVADEVKTRIIYLSQSAADEPGTARKLAGEILSQIRNGVPFADMARIHSAAPSRADGGENGWQELSTLNKALIEPIQKLKVGECSEVIETPEACFLVLLEDRRPAHYRPLSELRDDIEKELANQERSRVREQWITRLKAKTFVRYF